MCADNSGDCSLRAAVIDTNALFGHDAIRVPEGTYVFRSSSRSRGEDLARAGDLDITDDLTLEGAGAGTTIIDAAGVDRVVHIHGPVTVNIVGLTLQNGIDTGRGFSGGGMVNDGGAVTLTDSIVCNNASPEGGSGGIRNSNGSLTLTRTSVIGNGAGGNVGGIGSVGVSGTLTLIDSTVSENTAGDIGGGIFINGGVASLIRSSVTGNSAARFGGGLILMSGTLSVINSTVSGNIGGGLHNSSGGEMLIVSSTIADNMDRGVTNSGGSLQIVNTLIANNPGGDCSGGGFVSSGYNLDSDGSCNLTESTDLPNVDPLLGDLQDNDGSTHTHALLPGSPAIDAGTCDDLEGTGVTTDQRRSARPKGETCDIGAFEFDPQ